METSGMTKNRCGSTPCAQRTRFRRLRARVLIFVAIATALFRGVDYAASPDVSATDSSGLDFKQWGLVAIQDGGRRKPVDTFAKETLIRITGRSTYTDKTGRKWQPKDFVLSNVLETHDWKNEPMVLVSFGKLKEQLGLDKTQRRFSFTQLAGSAELQRIANEAQALKRAEKPLDRVQQEAWPRAAKRRRRSCAARYRVSWSRDRDALHDCRPAAGYQHV